MKAKDLRERSAEDLRELEKSLAKDTFQNRFKNFTNRLDDSSLLNKTRKDLARVKTILRQQELAAQIKAAGEAGVPAKSKAKKAAAPKAEAKAAKPAPAKKTTAKKAAKKEEAK
jgi:large subunit ribosomal protein L29